MNNRSEDPSPALEVLNLNEAFVGHLQVIDPTISLAGDDFDEASASSVIHHALLVHQYELAIRTNARLLCIAMYKCYQAYRAASINKTSAGWPKFCERNFSSLRMSKGNISAAIRSGEALMGYEASHPDTIAMFDTMSRAALLSIGGNAETLEAIHQVFQADPGARVTIEEVRKIKEQLNVETIERLKAEQQLNAVQQINVGLCESLAERKEQVERWQGIAEKAQIEAKTPVQAIEFQLPKGVASEIELKEILTKEISGLQQESKHLSARMNEEAEKLQTLKRTLSVTEQTKLALEDLQAGVSLMLAKFPKALADRMASSTPEVKEQLKSIAADLRTLALALDVS